MIKVIQNVCVLPGPELHHQQSVLASFGSVDQVLAD